MQKEAASLQTKTVSTSNELEELIKQIEKEAAEVDSAREIVEKDKEISDKATREAQIIKEECEKVLDNAIPKLNEAIEALDTLTAQDMTGEIINN